MGKNNRLIWLDLEMTGLDPNIERIIEIATVVTDKDLNIIEHGPNLVIKQSDELLEAMDAWNQKQHKKSGLIERVKTSPTSESDAQAQTIAFLSKHLKAGVSPMCGNSIGHDRRFLAKYMPDLEAFFHYRNLDVSSVKILATNWYPGLQRFSKKSSSHRALEDTLDSIEELEFYRKQLFVDALPTTE